MDYKNLQDRLRETYPNTWVGERSGETVVATLDASAMQMYLHVMGVQRNYTGRVMTSKTNNFLEWKAIDWIDNLEELDAEAA